MTQLDEHFLRREIEQNRRSEWRLLPQALFSIVIVVALVIIRQVYFL